MRFRSCEGRRPATERYDDVTSQQAEVGGSRLPGCLLRDEQPPRASARHRRGQTLVLGKPVGSCERCAAARLSGMGKKKAGQLWLSNLVSERWATLSTTKSARAGEVIRPCEPFGIPPSSKRRLTEWLSLSYFLPLVRKRLCTTHFDFAALDLRLLSPSPFLALRLISWRPQIDILYIPDFSTSLSSLI